MDIDKLIARKMAQMNKLRSEIYDLEIKKQVEKREMTPNAMAKKILKVAAPFFRKKKKCQK